MSWESIKIKELGRIITGKTPSSKTPDHFGSDYPFITPTEITSNRKAYTNRGISQKGYLKYNRLILPPQSVCVVCIGATIGKICLTTKYSLTNQQINSIVVNNKSHDPLFVYYYLSLIPDRIKSIAGGAATPIVNKSSFENISIVVPPLPTQRKIAAILSAYDDLIENNLRRIKILEEMAQNLYREWFVKFRFPGHEQARFVDSEMGRIPEGWELKELRDICDVMQSGGTPSRRNPAFWKDGFIDWYKTMELWDTFLFSSVEKITESGLEHSSAKLYETGTILMAIYGSPTVGRLGVLVKPGACNQAALGMKANPELSSQEFLFYSLLF